jgi:hypothetical protein
MKQTRPLSNEPGAVQSETDRGEIRLLRQAGVTGSWSKRNDRDHPAEEKDAKCDYHDCQAGAEQQFSSVSEVIHPHPDRQLVTDQILGCHRRCDRGDDYGTPRVASPAIEGLIVSSLLDLATVPS